jgi:hypothetical protein
VRIFPIQALLSLAALVFAPPLAAQTQAPTPPAPPAIVSRTVTPPAVTPSAPATPAPTPPVVQTIETPADALARDASEYAKQFSVSLDEATHRLQAQEESVPATDRIAELWRDRLAGISIEHKPSYRINVYLTGTTPMPNQQITIGGMTVPIVFRTGAKATRDQVIWAMTYHETDIHAALPSATGVGLDPRTGELVVIVSSATAAASAGRNGIKARLEAIAKVPVQVRVFNQVAVNLSAEGGSRVEGTSPADGKRYLCTTGFTVTDGAQNGVITAAHCLDKLTYYDPQHHAAPLDYVGQWGWGYRDVQINASRDSLAPLFYSDTAKTRQRPVTDQRGRTSTRAGDFVCHRGERTGYSCALVELTDFAPAGDLCGGACLPTWVTVAGPNCKGGDSGAPVFSGTTAFGIVKGASYRRDGSCAFYFYMSLDYLPMGWKLLRAPGTEAPMPPPMPVAARDPAPRAKAEPAKPPVKTAAAR